MPNARRAQRERFAKLLLFFFQESWHLQFANPNRRFSHSAKNRYTAKLSKMFRIIFIASYYGTPSEFVIAGIKLKPKGM
jgi:hypothetical protein